MKRHDTSTMRPVNRALLHAILLFALALAPAAVSGAGSFAVTGSMNTARIQHTATLLPNGKILVAGGAILGGYNTPAANWTFVGVGIETAPGQYQFTDPEAANHSRRFYRVKSP